MFGDFFKGKTVLITGHTGFKGSWLSVWLVNLGARVVGGALDEPSSPSNFKVSSLSGCVEDHRFDLRDRKSVTSLIDSIEPDVVFHLAAQALVGVSYQDPVNTISTNVIGSVNVLDALRNSSKPVTVIMITSDKVYDNQEWCWGYRENDRIGGKDPYSASKGMAELAIDSYVSSYFSSDDQNVRVATARAGNVIGGGDWALGRIVPDCVKSWSRGEAVDIRNPKSTRPWQHVLEPLSGYLSLAMHLSADNKFHSQAYNFGPDPGQDRAVYELINEMKKYWSNVEWKDASRSNSLHEANLLKLNCDKAQAELGWSAVLKFSETIKMTVEWYKLFYELPVCDSNEMYEFSSQQISDYVEKASQRGNVWVK